MKLLRILFPTFAAFGVGVVVGATFAFSPRNAAATPESQNAYRAVDQLGRVLVQVENNYVDPVERGRLVEGAIKGMVENLDPHSAYMPADEWSQFQSDTEGKFGGVGIEVDGRADKLIVIAPIEGSPAERAGIKSGDQIVTVDGDDVVGQPLDKVVKRMRGGPGSKVKITILREAKTATRDGSNLRSGEGGRHPEGASKTSPKSAPSPQEDVVDASVTGDAGPPERSGQTLTFELTREIIHVAAVAQRLLEGNVGYLRIKQFQDRTHDELMTAAGKLRAEAKGSLQGILLDVRSNPGGLVDEATEIADEFLGGGGIYSMRHRGQVVEDLKARAGGAFAELPVVVLVNEYSASASELLVGALQDNHRATVVGANTFGKGSVQSILPLPAGAGLKLTTARYYTPSGHAIQADGIHPDIVVESESKSGEPLRTLRERDLPGHLPPEGPQGGGVRPGTVHGVHLDGGVGNAEEVLGSSAREIPRDPSTSSDVALRVGYQTLRSMMKK